MTTLQSKINGLRAQKMTWQEIGDLIGISRALAWRVAHGKSDSIIAREYFGLSPKLIETEPCSCGEVHKFKTCPVGRKKTAVDRLAARVTKKQGKKIRKHIKEAGFNSLTEFWLDWLDFMDKSNCQP